MRPRHLTLAAACLAAATTGHATDLLEAFQRAQATDPTLQAAYEGQAAGREKIAQGRALFRPQVALAAGVTQVDDRGSSGLPPQLAALNSGDGSGRTHQVALQLQQPLVNARSRAEKSQLEQQAELAEIQLHEQQQQLVQRVGEAYFGLLLAQDQLRVVQAEAAAVTLQRERAQARFELGRGKLTEVQEAQARLDTVKSREVAARNTLAQREARYQSLTGLPPQGLAPLAPGFAPAATMPDDLQAWQALGSSRHTRVLAKQTELRIAEAEIGKYTLAARPTLDAVASYTVKGQSGGLSPAFAPDSSRVATIGLQLSVPLYTGGGLNAKEREARARLRQNQQELSATQRDVQLQVQDAYLAVNNGVARIGALEQSVRSAGTALDATTLGRDLGNRTELDVLDAQQRLYTSQLDLAQARTDYLLGRLRLAQAAGTLDDSELRTLNSYLAR